MRNYFLPLLLLCCFSVVFGQSEKKTPKFADKVDSLDQSKGYFNYYWSEKEGKIYLEIGQDRFGEDFLYVNSLSAGLGSNDIGLDRNQLGSSRVVHFERSGPKVLLLERNLSYRAVSENEDERQSVADAFAQSALAGFKIAAVGEKRVLIDITPMLLTDAHGVISRLKRGKQGTFKVDTDRSAVYLPRTKNFPKNSEFEALVTFVGEATGSELRSVAPTSNSFSLRMHHSFVELPDADYEPRIFDPRSGYYPLSYADYATPIDQPLTKRFIRRHRLEKKDPTAEMSDPVEPIIYYLDRGAPEPIRTALLEGASWWNQAFEAAGYRNAFQVKLLPKDADPLDVRYNVINWVHRSTRGWSYGSSVTDPRTGEIIKGHVLLGSLRVRQDFLIAQGLLNAYGKDGVTPDPRLEAMALARLRQLSAHEVGHTIGLSHNFAASTNDRASVMDYPHPMAVMAADGEVDLSEAYATGIGDWDKRTILYGYQDFPAGKSEATALKEMLQENERLGLRYISDADARPVGSAHPDAHLWDNGSDPVAELIRIGTLRQNALNRMDVYNIAEGTPLSEIERVFVPVYLMHRYQVEAVAKRIGGFYYDYSVNTGSYDESAYGLRAVDPEVQADAVNALLSTLSPSYLDIPKKVRSLLYPPALGYRRDREMFTPETGAIFDPMAAASAAAEHTLTYLLNHERLNRIQQQHALEEEVHPSLGEFLANVEAMILRGAGGEAASSERNLQIGEQVYHRMVQHLLALAANDKAAATVRGNALLTLNNLSLDRLSPAQAALIRMQLDQFRKNPERFKPAPAPKLPDGSPIGCGGPH